MSSFDDAISTSEPRSDDAISTSARITHTYYAYVYVAIIKFPMQMLHI